MFLRPVRAGIFDKTARFRGLQWFSDETVVYAGLFSSSKRSKRRPKESHFLNYWQNRQKSTTLLTPLSTLTPLLTPLAPLLTPLAPFCLNFSKHRSNVPRLSVNGVRFVRLLTNNLEKFWEILRNSVIIYEILRNSEKFSDFLRNSVIFWEIQHFRLCLPVSDCVWPCLTVVDRVCGVRAVVDRVCGVRLWLTGQWVYRQWCTGQWVYWQWCTDSGVPDSGVLRLGAVPRCTNTTTTSVHHPLPGYPHHTHHADIVPGPADQQCWSVHQAPFGY